MHIVASYRRALLIEIAPRRCPARLAFQWNEIRGRRTLRRNRPGNRTEQLWRANCEEKTGSGVVSIRTRQGCSILESEQGRRLPAGYRSADYGSAEPRFRPPN